MSRSTTISGSARRSSRVAALSLLARRHGCALALGAALTFLSAGAQASSRHVSTERFTVRAPVIDVQPVYREVRRRSPRQECWSEEQQVLVGHEQITQPSHYRAREQASAGNAIVGGLIGGVIGNQLGRGHSSGSRAGATVAGAIIGGAIANEAGGQISRHRRHPSSVRVVESRPIYETRTVERCKRVVDTRSEQELQHYTVTYRYRDREFVTRLPRDPGNYIELQVSVAPARR